jgi:DNA-directed RNA polymerase specialized sigma24 family protein
MVGPPPRRAAETEVIRRLEAEWLAMAGSLWLRHRLQTWAAEDERLAFEDGHDLVAAAQRRDVSNWAARDRVLAALLDRFEDDPVARRLALQVVLPGIKSLIDGLRGWDVEERAARVVATAIEVLAHCSAEPARTPPSFRVFTNTRRRALRAAIRDRSEPVVLVDDFTRFQSTDGLEAKNGDEKQRLEELVDWVRQRGGLREETARLVVLTRTGGVSVEDLAAMSDMNPQTLRQQRLRAERRLRRSLSLAQ